MADGNTTNEHDMHDHERWLAEISEWREEHARALETLEQAANFVRIHDSELDEHEKAIRDHEASIEAGKSETEAGRDTASLHEEVTVRHNRYRGRHKGVIEEITRLAVTLHKASHQPAP